jgi:hypothetical protein
MVPLACAVDCWAVLAEVTVACCAGEDKPTGFKKMLANTCQAEYEATEEARKVRHIPHTHRSVCVAVCCR